MSDQLSQLRRVVTGDDASGRSYVIADGPPPKPQIPVMGSGRSFADLWVWHESPPPLSDGIDGGMLNYDFPGPPEGGHARVVQANGPPPGFAPATDTEAVPLHPPKLVPPGRMWDRGGDNAYTSPMHKTETVDYGILLAGERILVLDECELPMRPGDIVIQVGAYHQWASPRQMGVMAFDMIAARFIDGPAGLAQGDEAPLQMDPNFSLPEGVEPVRRIVTIDREPGISSVVSDGPAPDVRTDPARPGFAVTRLWVTDSSPAKIVRESLHLPYTLLPPPRGSILNVFTIPPDDTWRRHVGASEVAAYFESMGVPELSTFSSRSRHPYMQKANTLDFCFILRGTPTLVLDMDDVTLQAGATVIQRGSNHAWSNRSSEPAIVAVASHATS